jgi:hypothetical protein
MTANPAKSRPLSTGMRRLRAAFAAALLCVLVTAPPALAAPNNDNFESPFNAAINSYPVTLGAAVESTATEQSGEPLTPSGPGTCSTRKMVATTWYRILGNGGVVSVNTAGSSFDTVLAAYNAPTPTIDDPLPCNDDTSSSITSAISFQSVAGAAYLIQVGGCYQCNSATTGDLVMNLTATPPPTPGTPPPPPPPPPPPDADGDGIPENGADKCPGVKPTRDVDKDGCQDKPKRILSDLKYDFRYLRSGGRIRGIALSGVQLTRAPKGAQVRVSCSGCRRRGGIRTYSFTTKRVGTQPMGPLNGVQILRTSRLVIVVTRAEQLGRRITVTMGARKDVVKLQCLAEGSTTKRVPCSTGS